MEVQKKKKNKAFQDQILEWFITDYLSRAGKVLDLCLQIDGARVLTKKDWMYLLNPNNKNFHTNLMCYNLIFLWKMKQKKEGFFRMFQQYVEDFTKETCVDVEEKKYNAAMTSYQKCMSISLQRK